MAPRPRHPTPAVQLVELACDARRRGLSFEGFWQEAVMPDGPVVIPSMAGRWPHAVAWPSDNAAMHEWRAAVLATREGWRRAYERAEPSRSDRAVLTLASLFAVEPEEESRRGHSGVSAGEAVAA